MFSRELLVLQAPEALKELISLPRLCLQEGHLFADRSNSTPGFKKLHGCCLGGFMFDARCLRGRFCPVTWEAPFQMSCRSSFTNKKTKLPLSFLFLSLSPLVLLQTLHEHSPLSPLPLCPGLLCRLLTHFDRKSKAGFAVSTSQAAGVSLLGRPEMERMSQNR